MLDADSGKIAGKIADAPASTELPLRLNSTVALRATDATRLLLVDTKALAIQKVPLESDTDFILYDPVSKRVFPINEKITVIEAQTGKIAGTVNLDADPEAAIRDGKGAD